MDMRLVDVGLVLITIFAITFAAGVVRARTGLLMEAITRFDGKEDVTRTTPWASRK